MGFAGILRSASQSPGGRANETEDQGSSGAFRLGKSTSQDAAQG